MRWALLTVAALAVAVSIGVILYARKPVSIEAEPVSRSIHEQVQAAIAPFGDDVPPERMPEIQKRAEAAFAHALSWGLTSGAV